jgi:sporulation protein YqfC
MFRIIVENQNHILIEGFDSVKKFKPDYISVYLKDILLELSGANFLISQLGEGYMQVSGEISQIKYTKSG